MNTTVSVIGMFGILDELQDCHHALEPLFAGAHSIWDVFVNFESLNQLERAGVYLYGGLELVTAGGLAWIIYQVIHTHFHKVKRHIYDLTKR